MNDNTITMRRAAFAASMLLLTGAALLGSARPAAACGGLFCNNNQSIVNQTAERILFVDRGNGKLTAAIEIQYQGTAARFAWVLPLPDIEDPDNDIRVSSTQAFDRLQAATNPSYQLIQRVEGQCAEEFFGDGDGAADFSGGNGGFPTASPPEEPGGVIVEASGNVGPYDYEFISVLPGTPDAAQAAIDWLADNNYDLAGGDELLRPYLDSGLKLLAIRLTKGNDTGSIRPLMIDYVGTLPSIPIRPTAVAAADDMGVMVFHGAAERSIPKNYKYLELNDSLINWFNPGPTYPQVINAAADEAGGQGFVTEYADSSDTMQDVVMAQFERDQWSNFQGQTFNSDTEMYNQASQFGSWDGFNDALASALTLPPGINADDVAACPNCYLDDPGNGVVLNHTIFRLGLYEQVVRPMVDTENLVQEQAYLTRHYTTMSAEDMTEDPVFDLNPDMGDLSNVHTADQVIECSSEYYFFEAPYRIELPSGLVVYGEQGEPWPVDISQSTLPAALTIAQAGTRGQPEVMVNNRSMIQEELDAIRPSRRDPGTDPDDPDSPPDGNGDGGDGDGVTLLPDGGVATEGDGEDSDAVCSCRAVGSPRSGHSGLPLSFASMVLGLWFMRRRR